MGADGNSLAGTQSGSPAEKLFNDALRCHLTGDRGGAEELYRQALSEGYRHPHLFANLAVLSKQRGDLQEALRWFRQALSFQPREPRLWMSVIQLLEAQGRRNDAVALAREALALLPDSAEIHCQLGWLLRSTGDLDAALVEVRAALALNPTMRLAHVRSGVILRDLGRLAEAEEATRTALAMDSGSAGTYMNLAVILRDAACLREALDAIHEALRLDPSLPGVHLNHASILQVLGQPEAALEALQAALEVEGPSASLLALWGGLLQSSGCLEEAEKKLREALAVDPSCATAYLALTQQVRLAQEDSLYQSLVEASGRAATLGERCDLWFARAKAEHDQRRYEVAAQSLREANTIKLRLRPSNATSVIAGAERIMRLFRHTEQMRGSGLDSGGPYRQNLAGSGCIFIVGMPRSGSTLLESILSMKSDCAPLGEVSLFPAAFTAMRDSTAWREHRWDDIYREIGERYIGDRAVSVGPDCYWSTDKMLSNYKYCGQILRALPAARIIHCCRQPLDVLLSMYRAHFSIGLGYASSLVDAARVYAHQHRLMEFYAAKMSGRIYSCHYERLVVEPEREVRRLVAWLGWDWDDNYLHPQRNRRAIATASVVQVRAPIHAGSVGGWRNYATLLEPAAAELQRLGISSV